MFGLQPVQVAFFVEHDLLVLERGPAEAKAGGQTQQRGQAGGKPRGSGAAAVETDVVRDGKPVIGYGFTSNGRYAQGGILRERFIPRIMAADPKSLVDAKAVDVIERLSLLIGKYIPGSQATG